MVPWPGFDVDLECVHQPPRAEQPDPHPGRGLVRTGQHRLQVGDAGTAVAGHDDEALRRRLAGQAELDLAAARVLVGVAGDLRDRGGDPRLVLRVEADQLGQPAGAAADRDDVRLGSDHDPQQAGIHGALYTVARIATTEASSRPRR